MSRSYVPLVHYEELPGDLWKYAPYMYCGDNTDRRFSVTREPSLVTCPDCLWEMEWGGEVPRKGTPANPSPWRQKPANNFAKRKAA